MWNAELRQGKRGPTFARSHGGQGRLHQNCVAASENEEEEEDWGRSDKVHDKVRGYCSIAIMAGTKQKKGLQTQRTKLKSRRDDLIIAQDKGGASPARTDCRPG